LLLGFLSHDRCRSLVDFEHLLSFLFLI
jgi:hypothetical protein